MSFLPFDIMTQVTDGVSIYGSIADVIHGGDCLSGHADQIAQITFEGRMGHLVVGMDVYSVQRLITVLTEVSEQLTDAAVENRTL